MTIYALRGTFELFDEAHGGMTHGVASPFRALHVELPEKVVVDGVSTEHVGVYIDVDDRHVVEPGDAVNAIFGFFGDHATTYVGPGTRFYVTAGRQRVGAASWATKRNGGWEGRKRPEYSRPVTARSPARSVEHPHSAGTFCCSTRRGSEMAMNQLRVRAHFEMFGLDEGGIEGCCSTPVNPLLVEPTDPGVLAHEPYDYLGGVVIDLPSVNCAPV